MWADGATAHVLLGALNAQREFALWGEFSKFACESSQREHKPVGARSASTNLWELAARAQKFSKVPSFSTPNINLQVKNTLYFILFLLPRPPKKSKKLASVAVI